MAEITADVKAVIESSITKRGLCACGEFSWDIISEPLHLQMERAIVPIIVVVCKNCGILLSFSAFYLGKHRTEDK